MAKRLLITGLHGAKIRKDLDLDCAFLTRKIKEHGEFEFYLITKGDDMENYQLNGYFDKDDVIFSIKMSVLFKPEITLFRFYKEKFNYKDLIKKIAKVIKQRQCN